MQTTCFKCRRTDGSDLALWGNGPHGWYHRQCPTAENVRLLALIAVRAFNDDDGECALAIADELIRRFPAAQRPAPCPDDVVAALGVVTRVAGVVCAENRWIVDLIAGELANARLGRKHNADGRVTPLVMEIPVRAPEAKDAPPAPAAS